MSSITRLIGSALVVRGDDIDTDRIMPARFLKAITVAGLESHLFEDDRRAAAASGGTHPFDDPARARASILIVGANFGCGSSREHAPQAIARHGFRAIVGESFGEIFMANAQAIGLVCVVMSHEDLARLAELGAASPELEIVVDLERQSVQAGPFSGTFTIAPQARTAFLSGSWDVLAHLLDRYEDVDRLAARLPY